MLELWPEGRFDQLDERDDRRHVLRDAPALSLVALLG